jgi:hypothetical protein
MLPEKADQEAPLRWSNSTQFHSETVFARTRARLNCGGAPLTVISNWTADVKR